MKRVPRSFHKSRLFSQSVAFRTFLRLLGGVVGGGEQESSFSRFGYYLEHLL